MVNREKAQERLEVARDRFTQAVADLHYALAELQAATLEASTPDRNTLGDHRLTVGMGEAARIMNVSRQTMYRWVKAGRLRAFRGDSASTVRISVEELRKLAEGPQ